MKIGIIGGGINGLMIALNLSKRKHEVTLYEKGELLSATSKATSKLIHGGLRYLENYQFLFVRASLKEREWWLKNYQKHVHPIKIFLPIYKDSRSNLRAVSLGLALYDRLFKSSILPRSKREVRESVLQEHKNLNKKNLLGIYSYYDAIMDDVNLGSELIEEAKHRNIKILDSTEVLSIDTKGLVEYSFNRNVSIESEKQEIFDLLINASGPWAKKLLNDSSITSKYDLDLIRGSHIVVSRNSKNAYILEIPESRRVFFVLPIGPQTLIGTTEISQSIDEPIVMDESEVDYLIKAYNRYFIEPISKSDIIEKYSGLRPLPSSNYDPSSKSRDFTFEHNQRLINVFGGKWTTSRLLSEKISKLIHSSVINNS